MSSIGSGPGISSEPIFKPKTGRVGGSPDFGLARQSAPSPTGIATRTNSVAPGNALDAGAAPIDQDRVAAIKKAIATHSYPVVPTKIGDAMIAAGMLLRMPK